MLSTKMEQALNDQINAEIYSAYLYLAMVAYFESQNLNGFAMWMKAQVQEELAHAARIFNYVFERGGQVRLAAIDNPSADWESPLQAFEAALKHEQYVSGRINSLVDLALEEKDHATNNFLQWFVSEQVEEEDSVGQVVNKLKLLGDRPGGGLFMLNQELSKRVFDLNSVINEQG